MAIDVTDATFQVEVIDRSKTTPVIVDLWAPWCGPCRTIGPILEKLTDATGGKVILAKVNVDENPAISAAFKVQSIPAVYALKDGEMVDGFVGAQSEHVIFEFVQSLMPLVDPLSETGDETSLGEALVPTDDFDMLLEALLPRVKAEEDARKEYLDILEKMGVLDPRSAAHRKRLTTQLF